MVSKADSSWRAAWMSTLVGIEVSWMSLKPSIKINVYLFDMSVCSLYSNWSLLRRFFILKVRLLEYSGGPLFGRYFIPKIKEDSLVKLKGVRFSEGLFNNPKIKTCMWLCLVHVAHLCYFRLQTLSRIDGPSKTFDVIHPFKESYN